MSSPPLIPSESALVAGSCLHHPFEAQVARTPDAVAVTLGRNALTYAELNARANRLARVLRQRGVGAETLVAVCLERSLELPIALLAVLKAGAGFLPLDPAYPISRLQFMIEDAQPLVVLTVSRFEERLPSTLSKLLLDDNWESHDPESNDVAVLHEAAASNVAYVMYTSGSTGTPKGVVVHHSAVVNHNVAVRSLYGLTSTDRVGQCTSISFDISVEEVFPTWMCGATLVLHPPGVIGPGIEFLQWLEAEGITVLNIPTAFWHEWVAFLGAGRRSLPRSLRLVIVGGQKASSRALSSWCEIAAGRVDWVNAYGPTETTVTATAFHLPRSQSWSPANEIPIGRPLQGVGARILDAHGEPCQAGEVGELVITGAGVARGYLNRPGITAQRFIVDKHDTIPGARAYRTGDMAVCRPDGLLEFRGRTDDQAKVRGFRVEPGEIEAVVRRHPLVRNAVVAARPESNEDVRIVAYVVLGSRTKDDVPGIRAFLRQELPEYMVPSAIVPLDTLPLTPAGKVDAAQLPAPPRSREYLTSTFCPPSGETETALARIWSEVLGIDSIGADDNFFDLGGHSLRAAQLAARILDAFGVDVPLSVIFANPLLSELARAITTAGSTARPRESPRIPIASRSESLPLSSSQERVWFLQRLHPESLAYNFQTLLCFAGALNPSTLRASLTEIVRRHEIFRTTFHDQAGTPVQRVHPPFQVDMRVIDLRGLPAPDRRDARDRHIDAELRRRFDLELLPLVRWTLLQVDDEQFELLHIEHHLVHDGWSFNVFRRELLQLYLAFSQGRADSPLPPLPIQFADYAAWERRHLESAAFTQHLHYWQEQLRGLGTLELPTSRIRPPVQTFDGALHAVDLPPDLYAKLRSFAEANGATLFMTLLTAFFVVLHRHSGQKDVVVGTGVANRRLSETEGLLGMLVNNVVLRSTLDGDVSFRELLARVRKTTLDAYTHQEVPFDRVVRALRPPADSSRNPLFQVMFSFHDSPLDEPVLPGITVTCDETLGNRSAKFDLNVVAVPHAEQRFRNGRGGGSSITLLWEYNAALFDALFVECIATHFRVLLEDAVTNPDRPVLALQMMDEREFRQVVHDWNRTNIALPDPATVHGCFESQVRATPHAVALVDGDLQLTYAELNTRANVLAHRLVKLGVRPQDTVALALDRSERLIVSMLAVLKAGAVYGPLDLRSPDERLRYMLRDMGARVLITTNARAVRCQGWIEAILVVDDGSDRKEDWPSDNLPGPVTADHLAYIMYTSGSTGGPKGVEVPHRAIVRLVWGLHPVVLDASTRVLHLAAPSFDAATFEVWGALLRGGTCVLHGSNDITARELGVALEKHRVTTLWLTSALFNTIIDEDPAALRPVTQLLTGGDVVSPAHVRKAQAALPGTVIFNGYGPTECTTFTCCEPIETMVADDCTSIPIGRPVGNTQVYLLDDRLAPVPVGVPGELFIGGDGVARGYRGQDALTAERFIANPFGEAGSRLYRSGDRARYRVDGAIEFLGRADHQVKVRGFRVELGEIESLLRTHAAVSEAVVLLREDTPGDRRLVGYVAGQGLGAIDLREHLRRMLPEYAVPSAFISLERWPLTSNGKIDRTALPPPVWNSSIEEPTALTPETETEARMALIWAEVLNVPRVGRHEDFFDLGGHSLLALRVTAKVQERFGVPLELKTFFEMRTVVGLSAYVDGALWARAPQTRHKGPRTSIRL